MRKLNGVLICAALLAGSFVVSGCSSSPSEEELNQLNALKEEATSLQNEIAKKEQEKAALEREIAEKNAGLRKCNEDQQIVRQRLGQ